MMQNPALLPPGFQDLLPPESDREAHLVQIISQLYASFGYRFVKPPLMEFENSFTASDMGRSLSSQTFRLMDPVSHAMMVVRADITPQIVRLAQARMPSSPRPLRLFYSADSLRVEAGQIRTARQFTQIGCECICVNSVDVDCEISLLALLSLKTLDLSDMTMDVVLPSLVPALLKDLNLSWDQEAQIKKSLHHKDISNLSMLDQDDQRLFESLLNAVGPADQAIEKMLDISNIPEEEKKRLHRIKDIIERLNVALSDFDMDHVSITFDPLETLGFDYHTGFGFALFSPDIQGELGRGGRYKACFSNDLNQAESSDVEDACGFSLYTDNLRKLIKGQGKPKRLWVPLQTTWSDIRSYQQDGWHVIRDVNGSMSIQDIKDMGCTHKLDGKKIIQL